GGGRLGARIGLPALGHHRAAGPAPPGWPGGRRAMIPRWRPRFGGAARVFVRRRWALCSGGSCWSRRAKDGCFMPEGVVKWFSPEKGYGFITPDDGGKDLFCHFSEIVGSGYRNLEEGQRV